MANNYIKQWRVFNCVFGYYLIVKLTWESDYFVGKIDNY